MPNPTTPPAPGDPIADCRTCKWFRPARPLSQLLAAEFGLRAAELAVSDTPLVEEARRVMQDEQRKRDAEVSVLVELLRSNQAAWGRVRPTMTDHCGFAEAEGVYLVHQLKNLGGKCGRDGSHAPRDAERPCATCRHRRPPTGYGRDAAELLACERSVRVGTILESRAGANATEEYRRRATEAKVYELAQTYGGSAFTGQPPAYLASCDRYSTHTEFVPCAVQNPHDRCPEWSSVAEPRMSLRVALEVLDAPPPAPPPAPPLPEDLAGEVIPGGFKCSRCAHFGKPFPRPTLGLDRATAGDLEAEKKLREDEERVRATEVLCVNGRKPFDNPPLFFPWCKRLTPSDRTLDAIRRGLQAGDEGPAERAEKVYKLRFRKDYARGEVTPVYVACAVQNQHNNCQLFEPRSEGSHGHSGQVQEGPGQGASQPGSTAQAD